MLFWYFIGLAAFLLNYYHATQLYSENPKLFTSSLSWLIKALAFTWIFSNTWIVYKIFIWSKTPKPRPKMPYMPTLWLRWSLDTILSAGTVFIISGCFLYVFLGILVLTDLGLASLVYKNKEYTDELVKTKEYQILLGLSNFSLLTIIPYMMYVFIGALFL